MAPPLCRLYLITPPRLDDLAAFGHALALMLVGVAILLPAILGYTVWVYWLFRGKVGSDAGYH